MYDAGGRRAPSTDVRMALAVRQVAGLVARYYIVLFTAVGRRCSLQASRELLSSGALTAVLLVTCVLNCLCPPLTKAVAACVCSVYLVMLVNADCDSYLIV